ERGQRRAGLRTTAQPRCGRGRPFLHTGHSSTISSTTITTAGIRCSPVRKSSSNSASPISRNSVPAPQGPLVHTGPLLHRMHPSTFSSTFFVHIFRALIELSTDSSVRVASGIECAYGRGHGIDDAAGRPRPPRRRVTPPQRYLVLGGRPDLSAFHPRPDRGEPRTAGGPPAGPPRHPPRLHPPSPRAPSAAAHRRRLPRGGAGGPRR